jgi:hypothetical protein
LKKIPTNPNSEDQNCPRTYGRTGQLNLVESSYGAEAPRGLGLPDWPKTISEVGANFFQLCFVEKTNRAKQQESKKNNKNSFESHTKWRVSSEMNIERDARRRKRGVISE